MNRSFGGTHLSDICEHLGPNYISGAICLSVPPFIDDFSKITTEFMDSMIPVLVNPETSVADYSEAVVAITDASVADGFDLPIETKWLFRGAFHSQVSEISQLNTKLKNLGIQKRYWGFQAEHCYAESSGQVSSLAKTAGPHQLALGWIATTPTRHIRNGRQAHQWKKDGGICERVIQPRSD